MKEAEFEVEVREDSARRFAELSGDWNPLHTDAAYAARTHLRTPVLHGAYAAGLVSRMAGMYLPGTACLLHGLRLRFVAPIFPPSRLKVRGQVKHDSAQGGEVAISIFDAKSGLLHTDGGYQFGFHEAPSDAPRSAPIVGDSKTPDQPCVLITGASGGLGRAVHARFGAVALPVSRADFAVASKSGRSILEEKLAGRAIRAAVHCGWPSPDNQSLTRHPNLELAMNAYLIQPVSKAICLARLLVERGIPEAALVLVGSTVADPGRHAYRSPLYTLGKSMLQPLVRTLALELAISRHRCLAVTFDVLAGGMSSSLSKAAKIAHADRSPWGEIQSLDEAAAQIEWLLGNPSRFLSGAHITLSGGALP